MKYLIFILFLCGCYTEKKATEQFNKAALNYPKLPADYCANEFPIIANTDSAEYKNSKSIIDSLVNQLKNDSLITDEERLQLISEIEKVRSLIVEPKNCDSLSSAIYKLVEREKSRGDKLQIAYNNLVIASGNLKPIHDTIINDALLRSCEIDKSKTIDLLVKKTAEADKYKGQAKKRLWIILGLLVFILIVTGLNIYIKSNKIKV